MVTGYSPRKHVAVHRVSSFLSSLFSVLLAMHQRNPLARCLCLVTEPSQPAPHVVLFAPLFLRFRFISHCMFVCKGCQQGNQPTELKTAPTENAKQSHSLTPLPGAIHFAQSYIVVRPQAPRFSFLVDLVLPFAAQTNRGQNLVLPTRPLLYRCRPAFLLFSDGQALKKQRVLPRFSSFRLWARPHS